MATQVLNSELDFDTIKASIKSYLEQHDDFTDYNFDASGLNVLLDALAYNTHQMAKISNFTLNEAFLNTAQLRASVVSHAKTLGYVPRSRLSAKATVNITSQSVPPGTPSLTLPAYTQFNTTIDGVGYTFFTLSNYTATEENNYQFQNVELYEGKVKTKKFFIDAGETNPIYVIPDENLDRTTMTVIIRDGIGSSSTTSLSLATNLANLNNESDIYLINESPNGYWELTVGDDVIGAQPKDGSILEATYLISSADSANGASSFSTDYIISGFSLTPTLVSRATGGSFKENIESVRTNAPLAFASQNRLVTLEDYKSFIANNISFVEAINIWGGANHETPEYGKVFISIKPSDGDVMSAAQKATVVNLIGNKSVLNVELGFEDPEMEYLDITAIVRFDGTKTSLTDSQIETIVNDSVVNFDTTKLLNFSTKYRKSELIRSIDDSHDSIVSVAVTTKLRKRFFPTLSANNSYVVTFTDKIKNPSESTTSIFQSTGFNISTNGETFVAYLRNKIGSNTIEMYRFSGDAEVIVEANAGSIDLQNNKLIIGPFTPTNFLNSSKGIELIITPATDDTISPIRNLLLRVDQDSISVNAIEESNTA